MPKGYNLLEAGDLTGRGASAIAAQVVSFAVRKNVRILVYPVSSRGKDFTLELLNADGVDPQERELLVVLFGPGLLPGSVRELGVTDDALARLLAGFVPAARASTVARGWRAKSSSRAGWWIMLGNLVLVIVGIVLLVINMGPAFSSMSGFGSSTGFDSPSIFGSMMWLFPFVFVSIVCLIVTVAAARHPDAVTESGAEQRDYLKGMKMYLQLAEADRFRMLQSPQGAVRVDLPDDGRTGPTGSSGAVEVEDRVQLVAVYEKPLTARRYPSCLPGRILEAV